LSNPLLIIVLTLENFNVENKNLKLTTL